MGQTFIYNAISPSHQVSNLEQKGVVFQGNDKQEAELFFMEHSHFKVNYHRQDFQQKNWNKYQYFPWTTRWDVYQRYLLESELKQCFFKYVSSVEASFKNILCYHTCYTLGNTWRTQPVNVKDATTLAHLLPIIVACDEYRKGNIQAVNKNYLSIIANYCKKYDTPSYPPFWNMMEVLTFWEIVFLYRGLANNSTQKSIAQPYHLAPRQLKLLLHQAVIIRNIVYHDNHLLFYTVSPQWLSFIQQNVQKITSILPNITHKGFKYAVAIAYSLLEPIKKADSFLQEVEEIFDKYDLKKIRMM